MMVKLLFNKEKLFYGRWK